MFKNRPNRLITLFYFIMYHGNSSSSNVTSRPYREPHRHAHSLSRNAHEKFWNGLRFWEQIKPPQGGFTFSVMSYNVLAQDLLNQHPYLYNFHQKEDLPWEVRWRNLFNEIRDYNPDILCLQEVQKSHLESHFKNLQNLGYHGLYKQRTGIRTDGCAIYYKSAMFNLIEYTTVEYRQPHINILDRDNVAIIAKFVPKNYTGKEFVVATTHLLYNPKREDVRLAQVQLLLTEIDRLAYCPYSSNDYLPIVLTGDFNLTPDSSVHKFLTKGKLKYENLASRTLASDVNAPTKMGKRFLPPWLRITDHCQHADLLPQRQENVCIPRTEELKLISLRHSERQIQQPQKKSEKDRGLFSSGTLTHNLSFKSVYGKKKDVELLGTTFQDRWVAVDYIFYSKQKSKREIALLERYRLPTKIELGEMKFPNGVLGSDHLLLLAKFQLF